ncbi:MAG: ABC transporter substrate-binding protein, partial [Candidatus Heimdallarchaeaceae archaeon]
GTADAAKAIRQAISYAVPRQTIVDQILNGLGAPATTSIPDSVVGYDESLVPYEYDLDLARDLVESAGYTVRVEVKGTGLSGLVFISFLGLASLIAFRKLKR